MKKILFLLLLITSVSYGQAIAPTRVKITNNVISTTAPFLNVQETDGFINKINKTDLIDVIEVSSATTLPVTGVAGKIYVTIDNSKMYRWNGTVYLEYFLYKEDKSNKGIANGYASLDAAGKVPLIQINDALLGSVNYKGTYNASTNVPALPTPVSTNKGHYYIVSTAGVQLGLTLNAGDWVISNGEAWGKVDNNNAVTSVNGLVGSVVLTTANIADSTNKRYQTDTQQLNNDATSPIQAQLNGKIGGTGTLNYISKFTGTGSLGNSSIFESGSNVGFGTTNPVNQVHISAPTGGAAARIQTMGAGGAQFVFQTPSSFWLMGNSILSNNGDFDLYLGGTDIGLKVALANRNVMIKTAVNNNRDALQVNGTILALPATASDQVVVKSQLDLKANIDSQAFTGTPSVPTPTAGSNDLQIANKAFVLANTSSGGSAEKTILYPNSNILFFGDSFTNTDMLAYARLFSTANSVTPNILGVSGAGWREAILKSYQNVSLNSSIFSVAMAGLNDLRHGGNNVKTFEKIKSSARALIANNFLKTAIPANSASISITGTWTTTSGITDKASASLSGLVRVSGASGSTLSYTFTSPNLVIGTFSTDESITFGGDFTYAIDGGIAVSYSGKNKTDGIVINGNDNSLIPNAIVITGLSSGSHTVVITSTETAPARIDYLGTMLAPEFCAPVILSDIPYLNTAGYAVAPANSSNATTDTGNLAINAVISEFNKFPVFGFKINLFYNSISADNVHPSNLGYVQIANGLQTIIKSGNLYTSLNPIVLTGSTGDKSFLGNVSDISAFTSNFNPLTGEIPMPTKSTAAIYLGGATADSYIDLFTSSSNNTAPTRRVRINKDGKFSIGNTNTTYNFDLSGTARVTGQTIIEGGMQVLGGLVSPIGSGGFELEYTGGTAYMTAYNRAGGAFLPLSIRASSILFSNAVTAPKIIMTGVINLKSYTVATLPTGGRGDIAHVTDALSPTYLSIIAGGGTVVTPVFFNGTNWVAH